METNQVEVKEDEKRDTVLESVLQKYCARAHTGYGKYRKTLDRKDLSFLEWCVHLQEELMDATLYLEKLQSDLQESDKEKVTRL